MATQRIRADVALEVGRTTPDSHPITLAATVTADPAAVGSRTVCFAFPGGGYTRHYWDLERTELAGPTQARYHADAGVVFIACDPYGGADSTKLDPSQLGLADTAAAVHFATMQAIERLAAGTFTPELPSIEIRQTVGIGHSLGGMQLISQQATHATFDAIGVLGFSAVHTTIPTVHGELAPADSHAVSLDAAWSGPLTHDIAHLRFAYHWPDVDPALVQADMSVGFPTRTATVLPPWISDTFPPFAATCMQPGVVSAYAALITSPVFAAAGERDVVPDLRAEATAYSASRDITLVELPRSAHMHNFSPNRATLWARLQSWFDELGSSIR